jgi:hypothetical protein
MMDGVLERIVAGFDRAGLDLPARRYWTTGAPVVDCEQLVASFKQAYVGPPGDEAADPQRCDGPRSASIEVHVTRCIPVSGGRSGSVPPSAEAIEAASRVQVQDAWLLLDLAPDTEQWDGLMPGRGLGVIATVEAGEPQGGYQSTVLNLTMAIP